MDRRQFLSALTVFGSGWGFVSSTEASSQAHLVPPAPAANILETEFETEHTPKVGIVAIGSAGGWILSHLNGKLPRLFRSVAVDTNQLLMSGASADRRILMGSGLNSTDKAAKIVVHAEAVSLEIASAITGVTQLFILTDMCGEINAELALAVAKIARRESVMTICAAIDPLDFSRSYTPQTVRDKTERLFHQGVQIISLFREGCGNKNLAAFGTTPIRKQAAAFERLYRSTVVTQEENAQSLVCLDNDCVQSVFSQKGCAGMVIGYGSAVGSNCSQLAAYQAISHPLFDADRERSDIEFLVSIEARPECLKFRDIYRAMCIIRDAFPYCVLIVGAFRNPSLNDDFLVTIVAPEAR